MKVFAFVLLAVVLAVGPVPRADAFYGSCSTPQLYFFAAPFTGMSTVEIVHSLDSLKAQGVNVTLSVTSATQLLVVINATADHVLNADFTTLDATYSSIQVAITDSFGAGASSLPSGQSLALSLAAAGLVAGTASGKPGMGLGAASLAAGAAVGLGLFGPLVSADSTTKCPNSFVQVTVYIPGTVRNYTINSSSQLCNVPYSLNATTDECTVCNSQFYVTYQSVVIPYPCVTGATECCAGEFCAAYTVGTTTLTHCCAATSQINSTTCCPVQTPVHDPYRGVCLAVCTNTTTGSPYTCDPGEVCYNNVCTSTSSSRSLEEFGVAVPDAGASSMNVAALQAGLERQAFPATGDISASWSVTEVAAESLP